jgi:hypothetical protein
MENFTKVCENPWCKGHFNYTSGDIKIIDGDEVVPKQCPKCLSFANDLSGGVTWSDKTYEGGLYDDGPHEIRYKITNFR